MEVDFSSINLQYLLQVRTIAQQCPQLASTVLGLPEELTEVLVNATDESLAELAKTKIPLLVVRGERWWWSRLFSAFESGRQGEIKAVLEHANLAVVN